MTSDSGRFTHTTSPVVLAKQFQLKEHPSSPLATTSCGLNPWQPFDQRSPCAIYALPFLMAYGMRNGMDVKIDTSGRIVVPKVLRDRLGLKPDMVLEVQEHADGLLLRVLTPQPTMVNIEGLWVHQGDGSGERGLGKRA